MSAPRHTVGAPAVVPDVRARRLLRFFPDAAIQGAGSLDWSTERAVVGGRRELARVLCRRELCLRSPPPTSAHRFRWPNPPTYTARTRDCLTIRSPRSRRGGRGGRARREGW